MRKQQELSTEEQAALKRVGASKAFKKFLETSANEMYDALLLQNDVNEIFRLQGKIKLITELLELLEG